MSGSFLPGEGAPHNVVNALLIGSIRGLSMGRMEETERAGIWRSFWVGRGSLLYRAIRTVRLARCLW